MANVFENACRLIEAATGERCGDGYIVTDVLVGCVEPGYNSDAVIVLGDWNPASVPGEDRWTSKHPEVTLPVRLAAALERIGAEIEWLDEWYSCGNCNRAVRAVADSYSWQPSYDYNDGEVTCHQCLAEMGEDAFGEYVNNPRKCLTWCKSSHVESFGFVKWEPGNEQTYESGWHPGQEDTPEPILNEILAIHPEAEVLFFLDESSQFYVRFSAYFRIPE